jgi:hypothetical protein
MRFGTIVLKKSPMKKLFLLGFLLPALTLHAQLEKGTRLGGLQLTLVPSDLYSTALALDIGSGHSNYGLSVVPTLGFVVARNIVVGGQAVIGYQREKRDYGSFYVNDTYSDLGIGPFSRFYIDITRNKKFKLFGSSGIDLVYSQYRNSASPGLNGFPYKNDNWMCQGVLGMGASYFWKKSSVDLTLSGSGIRVGIYGVWSKKK